MKIDKHKVVSIEYTLKGPDGEIVDRSDDGEPLDYLHGAGNIVPGLEQALQGKAAGEAFHIDVPPEMGYGPRVEELRLVLPRDRFQTAGELATGMRFRASTPDGSQVFTIVGIAGDDVTIDANHPLAGETLHFDVKVVDVRDARQEEIEHGHVHGPDGHHA